MQPFSGFKSVCHGRTSLAVGPVNQIHAPCINSPIELSRQNTPVVAPSDKFLLLLKGMIVVIRLKSHCRAGGSYLPYGQSQKCHAPLPDYIRQQGCWLSVLL